MAFRWTSLLPNVLPLLLIALLVVGTLADQDVQHVRVVAGQEAHLPCPKLTSTQRSSITLVIWYRNDMEESPIYSFDNRRDNQPQYWSDSVVLGNSRASYRPTEGHLALLDVTRADQGRYRCRVDFRGVGTVTGVVHLHVIVPPQPPVIRTGDGHPLANNSRLSLRQGQRPKLTCEVKQGYPLPRITWLVRNGSGEVRPQHLELIHEHTVTSELVIDELRRADLRTNITCSALNNNITGPVTTTITLDIYFRPLRVQIEGERGPLSVGRQYEYACWSTGSRPPAALTWYLDGAALLNAKRTTAPDGSSSTSTLLFKPSLDDRNKTLSCQAHNPRMVDGTHLHDSLRLAIRFAPVTTLVLSPMIKADNVKEGMGVFFECKVSANPPPMQVTWFHEGVEVTASRDSGVVISSNTVLLLQNVSRHSAGSYQCRAVNTEGNSISNVVRLRVMYAPVCAEQQRRVYGVSRGEQATVLCRVQADPPPTRFRWELNSSDQVRPVGAPGVTYFDWFSSSVTVTPQHDRDYGTLLCSAENAVGRQTRPCAFQLVPAGPPDALTRCQVGNQTDVSFQVGCEAGFDGGVQQRFAMELYNVHRHLEVNTTSPGPHFTVTGLHPGFQYTVLLYAVNAIGAGEKTRLSVSTRLAAEQRTGKSTQGSMAERRPPMDWTPLVGVVCGAALAVLACVAAVVVMVRRRAGRPVKSPAKPAAGLSDCDENNPDVVPSLSDGCSRDDTMSERRLTVVRDNCHTELYSPHPLNHVNFATFQGGSLGRPGHASGPSTAATTVMDLLGSDRESVV